MKKVFILILFSGMAISCENNNPTPCDCASLDAKNEKELTVEEMEIFYTYCSKIEYQIEQFVERDKPYEYALEQYGKYMKENCPEFLK
jgi:hypothetical protein